MIGRDHSSIYNIQRALDIACLTDFSAHFALVNGLLTSDSYLIAQRKPSSNAGAELLAGQ